MIIEFTGVPCSGKSAVSHELAKLLKEQGYTVCEKQYVRSHSQGDLQRAARKLLSAFKYCLRHPKKAFFYLKALGSTRLWLNYISLTAHRCKADFCLLEQGYLQLVGSCFDGVAPDREKIMPLVQKLAPKEPVVQVVVTASKETVLKRAKARKDKPFYLCATNPEDALAHAFTLLNSLKEAWQQNNGEARMIFVSNEAEHAQKEAAQAVLNAMKQKEII